MGSAGKHHCSRCNRAAVVWCHKISQSGIKQLSVPPTLCRKRNVPLSSYSAGLRSPCWDHGLPQEGLCCERWQQKSLWCTGFIYSFLFSVQHFSIPLGLLPHYTLANEVLLWFAKCCVLLTPKIHISPLRDCLSVGLLLQEDLVFL